MKTRKHSLRLPGLALWMAAVLVVGGPQAARAVVISYHPPPIVTPPVITPVVPPPVGNPPVVTPPVVNPPPVVSPAHQTWQWQSWNWSPQAPPMLPPPPQTPPVTSVPEPASLVSALIGVGMTGWCAWRRRRRGGTGQ